MKRSLLAAAFATFLGACPTTNEISGPGTVVADVQGSSIGGLEDVHMQCVETDPLAIECADGGRISITLVFLTDFHTVAPGTTLFQTSDFTVDSIQITADSLFMASGTGAIDGSMSVDIIADGMGALFGEARNPPGEKNTFSIFFDDVPADLP